MDSSSPNFDDDEREIHEEEEVLTPRRSKKKHTRNEGSESEQPESKTQKTLNPRSNVWQHFTRMKDNRDKCNCNYCGKEFSCPTKSGTKTLWNHLKICKAYLAWEDCQNPSEGQQVISKDGSLQSGKVPEHIFREALNEMVVIGELPLSFVECPAMRHFCNKVNLYKPHSRRTAGRDIVKIFVERKATLKKWFLTTKQRVSLTTDIWVSSVTGSSYMVITAHYIDKNWRLKKLIIGFKHVEDHRGVLKQLI